MLSQNKKGTYLQNVRVLKSTSPEVPDDLIHFGLSLSWIIIMIPVASMQSMQGATAGRSNLEDSGWDAYDGWIRGEMHMTGGSESFSILRKSFKPFLQKCSLSETWSLGFATASESLPWKSPSLIWIEANASSEIRIVNWPLLVKQIIKELWTHPGVWRRCSGKRRGVTLLWILWVLLDSNVLRNSDNGVVACVVWWSWTSSQASKLR